MKTGIKFIDWVRRRAHAGAYVKPSQWNTKTENEIIKTVNETVRMEKFFQLRKQLMNGGIDVRNTSDTSARD
jgi:hypothetical protein